MHAKPQDIKIDISKKIVQQKNFNFTLVVRLIHITDLIFNSSSLNTHII